ANGASNHCRRTQKFNETTALWNSHCHWQHCLLYMGRVTAMKTATCYRASVGLVGKSSFSRRHYLGVEKVCRSCRRNRWGAAAVDVGFLRPLFCLVVFGMIE